MTLAAPGQRVVVVGSGIIGIACAHYLSRVGLQVTVIDQGSLAGGCSHANCGYICPSHILPLTEPGAIRTALTSLFTPDAPFRIKPRLSPTLWYWLWQFARRCRHSQMIRAAGHLKTILDSSMREYERLMEQASLECEWTRNGLLYVLQTDRGMDDMARTDRLLSEHFDLSAQRIDGADLPALDPTLKPGLAGAFHYEMDASVRPDRLNASWAHDLQEHGVEFREQCELLNVVTSSNRTTRVETSQGDLDADWLVLATGAWSSQLATRLNLRIPVQPGKGYSVTMNRPDPSPRYPMLFPEHRVGVSPFENGYRLGSMMEFAGFDTSIPPRRIQQLLESARPYLVTPCDPGPQQPWYGWRPMTWDSLPIIGRVPRLQNTFLATGHNMLGVSLATATGRLISELVLDRAPHIDPTPYCPSRF